MAFALSKLLWAVASPGSLLAFLLALGVGLSATQRFARCGRALTLLACLCFVAIATLPVGEWALAPLENDFVFTPPDHVDGIVIIGGDESTEISEARGKPIALDSMRRYLEVARLSRLYPDARLVFSGGTALVRTKARIKDYEVARDAMQEMGVPVERMVFESQSRNTWENAVDAAATVHPTAQENWLLVTSAWHMPRSMGCFRQAGWHVYAAPAGYFTTGHYRLRLLMRFDDELRLLTMAAHEYIGLAAYWLMGRTSALWPA